MGTIHGGNAGVDEGRKTVTELQEKMASVERILSEQNSKVTDLSMQIEDLGTENRHYKAKIKRLEQEIKALKINASNEKTINQEKEESYKKQIQDLGNKIQDLETQLKEKDNELDVAKSNPMRSTKRAQVAKLPEGSGNTGRRSESPKLPATSRDVLVGLTLSGDRHKKK